jgi:peptidoglycan/xylan/chitin deacetylase (PgdA/CDA1 family)
MRYSLNRMVLAKKGVTRAKIGGASRFVASQATMLIVVSLCLAAILVGGIHVGQYFGVVPNTFHFFRPTPVTKADYATARVPGLEPPPSARSGLVGLDDRPRSEPSPSDPVIPVAATPSPSIMTRPPPKAGLWVPILMYHYIRRSPDKAGVPLSVLPEDFSAQMHYLKDHGYTTVTMRDLDLALLGRKVLPAKSVAITFDDGYQDFYSTAAPIMRPLGLTATNYIPTQMVGRPNYMTWSEIQQLDGEGFEMAAHSQFHVDVSKVSAARAQIEIAGSKADLEQRLGHAVVDWAYPYGGFSYATVQQVSQAGYVSAVTTRPGAWHDATQMPLLTRVRVGGGETLDRFARSLSP